MDAFEDPDDVDQEEVGVKDAWPTPHGDEGLLSRNSKLYK